MTSTSAPAISALLRRHGFNPVAPSDHHREGLKVKQSVQGQIRIVADLDSTAAATRMSDDAEATLTRAGYTLERPANSPDAFYVTSARAAERVAERAEEVAEEAHLAADRLEIEAQQARAVAYELAHDAAALRADVDGTEAPEPGAHLRGGSPALSQVTRETILRVLLADNRGTVLERPVAEDIADDLLAALNLG